MIAGAVAILAFFLAHWWGSVFFQSLFLHRYASHGMFRCSRTMERALHLSTYVFQGSSYLDVRGYAILHREHHAFTDTVRDPHAPRNHSGVLSMMLATKRRYEALARRTIEPEPRFANDIPEWPALARFGTSTASRAMWVAAYTAFYLVFASAWWQFLLLPVHFVMGPLHGAIVNWCGHRNGYRNFATVDESRNSLAIDVVTLGELLQNNHHRACTAANFARRWFEVDLTWQAMRVLAGMGLIRLSRAADAAVGVRESHRAHIVSSS
jgi:stearoyl-CoA desaturase (delta-9 desaturase)